MEGVQVIKVRYEKNLRRYSAPAYPLVTFDKLDTKIRAMFDMPLTHDISLTYTDAEKDEVVMADDEDLHDALLIQGLNPLRVSVKTRSVSGEMTVYPTLAKSSSMVSTCSQPLQQVVAPLASHDSGNLVPDLGLAKIQTDVEQHIRATLSAAGLSEDVYASFLQQCPSGIAEIIQTALNSGINVTFETVYEDEDSPVSSPTCTFTAADTPADLQTTPSTESKDSSTLESSSSEKMQTEEVVVDAKVSSLLSVPALPVSAVPSKEGEGCMSRAVSVPVTRKEKDLLWAPPAKHVGIACDACDSCPITGTRYKCLTKEDYDLCPACYVSEGARSRDYSAIAKPLIRYTPLPRAVPAVPTASSASAVPVTAVQVPPRKDERLDSRFIRDVTIPDSTKIRPNMVYTKVWHMRNNGSMPWPALTRVVHTGGERMRVGMRDTKSVALKFPSPSGTLLVGEEMDVAVTLRSPPTPGQHMSHWRLQAPDGTLFGHRVWAMIQVLEAEAELTPPRPSIPYTVPDWPAHCASVEVSEAEKRGTVAKLVALYDKGLEGDGETGPASGADVVGKSMGVVESLDVRENAVCDLVGKEDSTVAIAEEKGEKTEEEVVAEKEVEKEKEKVEVVKEEKTSAVTSSPLVDVPVSTPLSITSSSKDIGEVEKETEEEKIPVEDGSDSDAGSDLSEGASSAKSEVEKSCFGEFSVVRHPSENGDQESVPKALEVEEGMHSFSLENHGSMAASALSAGDEKERMKGKVVKEWVEGMGSGEGKGKGMVGVVEEVMAMGFEGREMIEELVGVHGGNVEEVVKELLVIAEWDPIVAELVEMGFDDENLNRRVLFNNKGSVKEATKELVRMVIG